MVKPLVPVTEAETNCRRVWMPVRLQRRNSMKKRILSLFCVLALCLTLLPITALAAQDPVWYIERDWDGSMVTEQTKTIDTYTLMDENTVTWGESTTGGCS